MGRNCGYAYDGDLAAIGDPHEAPRRGTVGFDDSSYL
jgi:hypothetical protein